MYLYSIEFGSGNKAAVASEVAMKITTSWSENDKHAEIHQPASFHIFILPLKMNKTKQTKKTQTIYRSCIISINPQITCLLTCVQQYCVTLLPNGQLWQKQKNNNKKNQENQPTSVTTHSAAAWLCENFCVHARLCARTRVSAYQTWVLLYPAFHFPLI